MKVSSEVKSYPVIVTGLIQQAPAVKPGTGIAIVSENIDAHLQDQRQFDDPGDL